MTADQILEIFKEAITPEYQQYFEVNTSAESIRFTQYVANLFNNYDVNMFNYKFFVLAYIAENADVDYYEFYFDRIGHVNCRVKTIASNAVTVEVIKEILDNTVKFIQQTLVKYKNRKRCLMIKQIEGI